MNLHEYQSKQMFRQYGIPVLPGAVATTASQAAELATDISGGRWVVKAQIHAGGRAQGHFDKDQSSGGGVRIAESIDAVGQTSQAMLNHVLFTSQTGPSGREVKHVYIEQHCQDVNRELYLAMFVDRGSSRLVLLASTEGGVNIESVGSKSPESIHKLTLDPDRGAQQSKLNDLMKKLSVAGDQAMELNRIVQAMHKMFISTDASLVEINPLAVTQNDTLVALDATVTLDDNALFRHPEFAELRDDNEFLVGELQAAIHGLNYVKLDGNVGCLASGAGLSLATIDAVKLLGGAPANFLDIPPVAEVERVKLALRLVATDPDVKSILVNVFGGGIMRCDTIADAIVMFNRERRIEVPLIVRLAGTNAEFAIRRLKDMGPELTFAENLADAARKAVSAVTTARKVERGSWWRRVMNSES